jgi:O-methyltransferase involved in polyketide biosynthesis
MRRQSIPMNFQTQRLDEVLAPESGFNPRLPTAFIYEGCSMYFDEPTNAAVILAAKRLMQHRDSLIWVDFVGDDAVSGRHDHESINVFLRGMEELGESFVYGRNDPAEFLRGLGFSRIKQCSSDEFFDTANPVAKMYRFTVSQV